LVVVEVVVAEVVVVWLAILAQGNRRARAADQKEEVASTGVAQHRGW